MRRVLRPDESYPPGVGRQAARSRPRRLKRDCRLGSLGVLGRRLGDHDQVIVVPLPALLRTGRESWCRTCGEGLLTASFSSLLR